MHQYKFSSPGREDIKMRTHMDQVRRQSDDLRNVDDKNMFATQQADSKVEDLEKAEQTFSQDEDEPNRVHDSENAKSP